MSKIALKANDSGTGTFEIQAPATNTNRVLELPDEAGKIVTNATPGTVLQVVNNTLTGTAASTTPAGDYTSSNLIEASITPTSASSKILIIVNAVTSNNSTFLTYGALYRGSTAIGIGDAASARRRATSVVRPAAADTLTPMSISYLDSPSTTSATTYGLRLGTSFDGPIVVRLNRTQADGDTINSTGRSVSSITLMEIAG